MKIWTLIENTAAEEGLCAEHGLSLYIESGHRRILLDTGQSGAFAANADRLGIALGAVDTAVLSHGHYDHGGGLGVFFARNPTAPVYLSPYAWEPHYHGPGRYIGLDRSLARFAGRFVAVTQRRDLGDGFRLEPACLQTEVFPVCPGGLQVQEGGRLLAEDFRHEIYLLAEQNGLRILFSGCSHKGVLNLLQWYKPDVFVGGFHTSGLEPQGAGAGALAALADGMLRSGAQFYTGHCTGAAQYAYLKQRLGPRLHRLTTGSCTLVPGTESFPFFNENGGIQQ